MRMAIGIVQTAMKLLLSAKVAENELIVSHTAPTAARRWTEVTVMRLIDADIAAAFAENCGATFVAKRLRDSNAFPEVVTRCKDCRNHRELNRKDRLESGYAEGVLWCMNRSDGVWADGFCSDGERREV